MINLQQFSDGTARSRERRLPALAVSRGIGIGKIVYLHGDERQFFRIDIPPGEVMGEIERLRSAVAATIDQLNKLATNDEPDPDHPVSSIFGVHLLILQESSFVSRIEETIAMRRVNAEWALKIVADEYAARQATAADVHFREKQLDIEDVAGRLVSTLDGSASNTELTYSGAVIAARELRPSAIMELMKVKPAALITERGGWTSHVSILAREFKLPMVSGIKDLDQMLAHGDAVIVDGVNGEIIVHPDGGTIDHYRSIATEAVFEQEIVPAANSSLVTTDGVEIVIQANADSVDAYRHAKTFGAEGVGLYRSESLIARPGVIPSEEEQIAAYVLIADEAGDGGVKIRTFDIGLDQSGDRPKRSEHNPSLGLRSIRLSLADTERFRSQIGALLRASYGKNINIVLPMVSGVDEVVRSKAILSEVREQLVNDGVPIGDPKLGVMIEVPSAVLTAREIAKHVDFICLGTNDLVQYLLAVDRDNDAVAEWYQTLHPAVIGAIETVLQATESEGITAGVCGEMAGSCFYVPLLLGLGARQLSMNINSITQVRRLIAGISAGDAVELVKSVRGLATADEIETKLREYYVEHWSHLFPPGHLNTRHR